MKKALRIILWLAVIAVAVSIFIFSNQTGSASSGTSNGLIYGYLARVDRDFLSLDAETQNNIVMSYSFIVRKAAHFSVYMLLGCLTFAAFTASGLTCFRKSFPLSLGICTAYAILDEVHQHFVPGRSPELRDIIIDSLGAVCGTLIITGIRALLLKKHKTSMKIYQTEAE